MILDRIKFLLRNDNVSYDIIYSVIDGKFRFQNDLLKIYLNTKTLSSFMETKEGETLKALWIRVSSILSIEEKKNNSFIQCKINSLKGYTFDEIKLIKRIQSLKLEDQYVSMLKSRSKLSPYINNFFDISIVFKLDCKQFIYRINCLQRIYCINFIIIRIISQTANAYWGFGK